MNFKFLINDKRYKTTCISALVFSLLSYLYLLTNNIHNYDSLFQTPVGEGTKTAIGRWLLDICGWIQDFWADGERYYNSPMVNITITIAFLIGVCLLLTDILELKSILGCVAISAITVSFPAISVAMLFSFTIQMYAVALFLTILGVFLAKRKGYINLFISILCITFGLGGYQAYFPYAVVLMLFVLVISIMDEDKEWKNVLLEGIKYLIILITSLISYAIIQKIFQTALDKEMVEYQNADKMWEMDITTIPGILKIIYHNIFHLSNAGYLTLNNTFIIRKGILLLQILSVICIGAIVIKLIKKKQYQKVALFIIIMAMHPIACDLIELMAIQAYWKYSIMGLGIIGVFYLPVVLIDRLYGYSAKEQQEKNEEKATYNKKIAWTRTSLNGVIPVIILICALNYAYVNTINYTSLYYKLKIAENYTIALYGRIISCEGYSPDKKIIYYGSEFKNAPDNTWNIGDLAYSGADINVNVWSKNKLMKLFLGKSVRTIKESEAEKYNDIIDEMGVYPESNSIIAVDNKMIVKIAD